MSKLGKKVGEGFAPRPLDTYDTPRAAVAPLLAVLRTPVKFIEPCAGAYALAGHLEAAGHVCIGAYDIAPRDPRVRSGPPEGLPSWTVVITNPPFTWASLEPLLLRWLQREGYCWLLLPSDMLCNAYFGPYAGFVDKIVPIGRVRWIEGSKSTSTDNFVWVRFDPDGGHEFLGGRP